MQLAMWTLPVSVGCGLILIEPDIGTMSVVAIIAFVMLGVAGLSGRLMATWASLSRSTTETELPFSLEMKAT